MQLSPHFTLEEMTRSEWAARHGFPNQPGERELANLQQTAIAMEMVRQILGGLPIHVSSGYRSAAVNAGVGGARTSAHVLGLACDFQCPDFGTPYQGACCLMQAMKAGQLDLDQLILEYGWVHVGLANFGQPSRRMLLTKRSALAPYEAGINA